MARSLKHTRRFEYTRHNRVLDNIESQVNYRELRRELRRLEAKRLKGQHIEIRSHKTFTKRDHTRLLGGRTTCFSLTWYTRKDKGPKAGVQATA